MALEIVLTDFVDFTISSGVPKLTKVREVRDRGPYEPAHDFWKRLRDGIVRHHRDGADKAELDAVLATLTDTKKVARYPDCIHGYKKFLGKKDIEWFEPPAALWSAHDEVKIRVKPELGLRINGVPHVVKLHFKSEKLTKRRIEIILLLMSTALADHVPVGTQFAILDVPQGKIFATQNADAALLPLLVGEAVSFHTMWSSLN